MYTQGNHNPQPGQGLQKPMSSPYPHCLSAAPTPIPQFQPGPAAPHQNPPGGLPNAGPSYLHQPFHVHAGAPLPHVYQTAQQNLQHNSHLGTQIAHNMPQQSLSPPISASHLEVFQTHPPFRALPPPPPLPQPQGQTFYRAPVNTPPQRPGLLHISSNPTLTPTTSFFSSAPQASFIKATGGDNHVPLTTPLLPHPSLTSSPPIQPSPPPSTSTAFLYSKPFQHVPNLPCNLDSDGTKLSASGSVDRVVAQNQFKHNFIADNGSKDVGGDNGCSKGSIVGDKISFQEGLTVDLSSTPPKPTDQNIIERIETLCLGIAKNGPTYEEIVRKSESGKPEYSFLYGGEPGSEAAIAHDYFQWMKKKSILASKLHEQQGDSSLRPLENKSSEQPCHLAIAASSHSPDDSDMEMEDDITQVDEDQGINHSHEGLNSPCGIVDKFSNMEGQLHPLLVSTECNAYKDSLSEKPYAVDSSRLGKQDPEETIKADQTAVEASTLEVKLTLPHDQPFVTNIEKSGQLGKGGSPFRLIQDYASDDNSEKDVETSTETTNVLFGAKLGRDAVSNLKDNSSLRQPEKGFEPLSSSSMPCLIVNSEVVRGTLSTSNINGDEHIDSNHVHQVSINKASCGEVFQNKNFIGGASVNAVKFSKEHSQEEGNLPLVSQNKVDKFGRMVRNGANDSDSDDLSYIGRHRRGRTRSRSHSRSPPDRRKRRSPRRRREKRSLSRSLSPRNQRSRSRSPRKRKSWNRSPRNHRSRSRSPRNHRSRSRSPRYRRSKSRSPRNRRSRSRSPHFRRADEFSGENKRRVKGQVPFCFDFLRGRCYRGVSCRYLHHDSSKSDESKQQRRKEQYMEFPQNSRTNVRDEIKQIPEKAGDHEHGEVGGPEVKLSGNFVASRDKCTNEKTEDSVSGGGHNQDSQSTEYHMPKSEKSRDIPPSIFNPALVENKQEVSNLVTNENCQEAAAESHHPSTVYALSVGNIDILNSYGNASQKLITSFNKSVNQESLSCSLDPVHQNVDHPPQQTDNLHASDFSPHKTSTASRNRLQGSNAHPNTMELHSNPSHIAFPSFPCSNEISNLLVKQQQTASSLSHSSGESFPSYMFPNQHSFFALQPNFPLTSLPPPPRLTPQDSTVRPAVSSHVQPSEFPSRNDFSSQNFPRPYPTELPAHSQSDGFQQRAYLPIQEMNQPFLHPALPACNLPIQQFGDPSKSGNHGLTKAPMQNVTGSNSLAPVPFSQQVLGNKMQPFSSETLTPVDGRGIGLQQATSTSDTAKAFGQNFSRSGGDQYDPLFDSIEPSSGLSRKFNHVPKLEATGDSDVLLGLSGSNKPLDMEENKRKDSGAVASAASADNEEIGETSDAEAGAVEIGSKTNPVEVNMGTHEIEIDQVKSPGKSKKSKDSRSMKLFKVALADFVKEVLKPSWQQGNMSKEAFKTIVKKTVDKVSGAMKSHHIPKSRAKIDHYIESSQRKLTKLVMGYVDKCVKV